MKPLPLQMKKKIHASLSSRHKAAMAGVLTVAGAMGGYTVCNYYSTPLSEAARTTQNASLGTEMRQLDILRANYSEVSVMATVLDSKTAAGIGITYDKLQLMAEEGQRHQAYVQAATKLSLDLIHADAITVSDFSKLSARLVLQTPADILPPYMTGIARAKDINAFIPACRKEVMATDGFTPSAASAQQISDCTASASNTAMASTLLALALIVGFNAGAGRLRRHWDKALPLQEQAAADAEAAEKAEIVAKIDTGTGKAITVKPIKITPRAAP